jgi:hypothetical protein
VDDRSLAYRMKGERSGSAILPAIALAATTAAAAATAAAATAAATTATATAAILALFSLVDSERTAIDERAVELRNGLRGLLRSAHRDECKTARLPGLTVGHDVNVGDLADCRKCGSDGVVGSVERKVADVKTIAHVSLFSVISFELSS